MMRALLRLRGAPPVGGGGESGGDPSLSGLARFPRDTASAFLSFSSFCERLSSQHWSSLAGWISSVILSNSLSTHAVRPSQMGGSFSGSTAPASGSLGGFSPSSPSSSSESSESLELSSSLLPVPLSPPPLPPSARRTRFLVKSGGWLRDRFSHSSSMRTATRNDVRPKRLCVSGDHSNHGLGLGGLQFLGTKNSSPSRPCSSSGWSKNSVDTFLITCSVVNSVFLNRIKIARKAW
mmetsp:Transcript_1213/g.2809  ORF Transcript_1213/g.2809 Transcript_1213/m.2809 type:complete len:236 (-) Transcript_1213:227-934(-)